MANQLPFRRSRPRRRPVALAAAVFSVLAALEFMVGGAVVGAVEPATLPVGQRAFVDVVEVSGYLDRVQRDFVLRSIDVAVADGAQALVIQLDSPGSILPAGELDAFVTAVRDDHRLPIGVWVGGGGSPRAHGGAVALYTAADVTGMSRLANIGDGGSGSATSEIERLLAEGRYDFKAAQDLLLVDVDAPVLPEFVGRLDGRTIEGRTVSTATLTAGADGKQVYELKGVRFGKLSLLDRLVHTASNPSVAYFLFVVALALFVFEFFTGGIGVAATVGLMAFVLAVNGLGFLPTSPVGIALVLLAFFGYAVDVQAGQPRAWTVIATVSFLAGSLSLYGQGIGVPWFVIAVMAIMVVLFMVNGMPNMVRTRFATPTIGREAMIGEQGVAQGSVSPDGIVVVRGAPWRARTNRSTPIDAGEEVRVVAIDGLLLEVEPLVGAARDAGH